MRRDFLSFPTRRVLARVELGKGPPLKFSLLLFSPRPSQGSVAPENFFPQAFSQFVYTSHYDLRIPPPSHQANTAPRGDKWSFYFP